MGLPNAKPSGTRWLLEIAEYVSELTGIQLGEKQRSMVESRLLKRIRDLGLGSPEQYVDYLKGNSQKEVNQLVGLLTTHHTFFFREFGHFEFLETKALPKMIEAVRSQGRKTIRIWAAACSQGQEVYSLSMFMSHQLKKLAPDLTYEILGTDVDPESVARAKNGVYRWSDLKEIPLVYLMNHWVRGTGDIADYAKAKPSIKRPCRFETQNLVQLGAPRPNECYDIIFCRNVFIYFSSAQVQTIVNQMDRFLDPKGYLFIGASESLMGMNVPVTNIGPSVYVKKSNSAAVPSIVRAGLTSPGKATLSVVSAGPENKPNERLKVMCVDDSPTIITLLKKILSDDFDVVATAKNGIDAANQLANQKIDVMTLDIHMPEQSGIAYLEKNFRAGHPPVIVVSSVPREDSQLALRCLELGAIDYVEKPAAGDITSRADEIRTKIRCAVSNRNETSKGPSPVDKSFQRKNVILSAENKFRIVFAGIQDKEKLVGFLKELDAPQPPTVVFIEGARGLLPAFAQKIQAQAGRTVTAWLPNLNAERDVVYLADLATDFSTVLERYSVRPTSLVILGQVSERAARTLLTWTNAVLAVEEIPGIEPSGGTATLLAKASYRVPHTSLAYHSIEALAKSNG